jgi:hypothetical protein
MIARQMVWAKDKLKQGLCSICGKHPRVLVAYFDGDDVFEQHELGRCKACRQVKIDRDKRTRQKGG